MQLEGSQEGMESRYHVVLAGPIPAWVAESILSRFGDLDMPTSLGGTVLDGFIADQSALRALLNLLWDAGGDIRLVSIAPATPCR